jgi:hypothetical protein
MREAYLSATGWLGLAAAPTFAIMALTTSGGAADLLCAGSSPLGGMTAMYLLMSMFHLPPWLKLIAERVEGTVSVIASEAKQSRNAARAGLLRRSAPRKDETLAERRKCGAATAVGASIPGSLRK